MPPRLHAVETPITPEMRNEIVQLRTQIAHANRLLLTAWKHFDDVESRDTETISQVAETLQELYARETVAEARIRSALAQATSLTGTELDCLCAASIAKLH